MSANHIVKPHLLYKLTLIYFNPKQTTSQQSLSTIPYLFLFLQAKAQGTLAISTSRIVPRDATRFTTAHRHDPVRAHQVSSQIFVQAISNIGVRQLPFPQVTYTSLMGTIEVRRIGKFPVPFLMISFEKHQNHHHFFSLPRRLKMELLHPEVRTLVGTIGRDHHSWKSQHDNFIRVANLVLFSYLRKISNLPP